MVAPALTPTSLRQEMLLRERLRRRYQPDEAQVAAERSFRAYIEQAWHVVEPATPFVPGFHIDAIAEHLQAVSDGQIQNLLINVPPRHMKSLETCVFWPSWEWGPHQHPWLRWLFSSYASQLSTRDSLKCRRLIESPWYQGRWGDRFHLTSDQNVKTRYDNDHTGFRIATSVEGLGTGEGGDRIVVDDPHSARGADSEAVRESTLIWWDETMSTRGNDPETVAKVIVMQRLHERDLSGHVLAKGGYEHLCLPAEYEPTTMVTGIGWRDPRTEPGQLLWPERFSRDKIEELKRDMGTRAAAGQLQQRPAPASGTMLQRTWWRFWHHPKQPLGPVGVKLADGSLHLVPSEPLPPFWDDLLQSWDMTFKDTAGADFVAGQVWGVRRADRYLLDQLHGRWDFPTTVANVRNLRALWPRARRTLIEDKANGPAVIASLRREMTGLVAIEPEGGKIARVNAVSPMIESGNVYLPHPDLAPWVHGFIEEAAKFPAGAHDDQVDAMSQALNWIEGAGGSVTVQGNYLEAGPDDDEDPWGDRR